MNLTQKFLTKGKEKEIEFLKSYCSHFNISERCVEIASAQDDIHRHVDLWIDNEGWDVKAAKKKIEQTVIQIIIFIGLNLEMSMVKRMDIWRSFLHSI